MLLRCLVVVGLSLAVQPAHIRSRNIPVEVVYENSDPLVYSTRNLDAKIQLSSDELLKLKLSDDIIHAEVAEVQHGVRNLDAKVQLSEDELALSAKFLPNVIEQDEAVKEVPLDEKPAPVEESKPQDNNNLVTLLKRAEAIAYSGINTIKDSVDKASAAAANVRPGPETWLRLNKSLNEFFDDQYKRANLKADNAPDNQNQNNQIVEFFQGFMTNFQSVVNNFQGGSTEKPAGSEDEQTGQQGGQNFFQVFVSYVTNGVSQMVSNVNAQNSGNSTGQEDTGTGGNQNNFFTNVGAFFQGIIPQGQGNNPSNQSDTGVQPPSNPLQIFQQTISNAINNFASQGQPSSVAPVQGDEGTGTTATTQSSLFGIGNINQAISSGVQTIGQLGQGGSAGGGSSPPGVDQITSIGNQIGQQLTGQGQGQGQGQGGTNPIQQAIGQFAGGEGGNNPILAIGSQIGNLTGGQAPNPLEGIQNALGGGSSATTEKTKADHQKDELVSPEPTATPKETAEAEKKPVEVEKKVEDAEVKPVEAEKEPVEAEKKPADVPAKVE